MKKSNVVIELITPVSIILDPIQQITMKMSLDYDKTRHECVNYNERYNFDTLFEGTVNANNSLVSTKQLNDGRREIEQTAILNLSTSHKRKLCDGEYSAFPIQDASRSRQWNAEVSDDRCSNWSPQQVFGSNQDVSPDFETFPDTSSSFPGCYGFGNYSPEFHQYRCEDSSSSSCMSSSRHFYHHQMSPLPLSVAQFGHRHYSHEIQVRIKSCNSDLNKNWRHKT